ncbi:MAG TPA: ABC transporter permease subunit [Actinomycetota bacterium]|nr:ABC transporter permease subunit [Actinomycetota bacterium]
MERERAADGAGLRPPPWRDVRVLRIAFQVLVVGIVAGLGLYLVGNLTSNLDRQGIRTDFGYLSQPAGFAIADTSFRSTDSVLDALKVGIRNTAVLSLIGIVFALFLGIVVGVARLSRNWLVRKAAAVYVESLRNIPVLVIIIFFYIAVVLRLPPIQQASEWFGAAVISNSGAVLPSLRDAGAANLFTLFVVAGFVAGAAVAWMRTRRFDRTGEPHHRVLWFAGVFFVVAGAAYLVLGRPVAFSLPVRDGLVVAGGIRMPPEFAAMLVGLVVYTASHIAEIVRGSILAVARGQSEAATALGLTDFQRLRFVVLPQAFRIMIPPLANQFLNLTKNSSLAVFIGYADVASVTGIIVSQGNPAPQSIVLLMAVYLVFSLTISLVTNTVNRRMTLTTR